MSEPRDLDRIVADWLRAEAPTRAPGRVLSAALEQVGATGQQRPFGGRPFDAWIGRSPRLHWAIVGAILALLLLGAVAGAGALLRVSPTPRPGVVNGWIAYSTDGQNPGSTDVTTGSDIYLVREGGEPRLIAGRDGGTTRNVCPAFSPDGTRLAFGEASAQGRAVVVLGVDASGVTGAPVRITVPGPGPAVCVRWSSDGTRVGYLDGGAVVVRGLDGSTPAAAAGDPAVKDLERVSDHSDPLLSPSGDRVARLSFGGNDCQLVVAMPDGTAAHVIQPSTCGYAVLAAWSPDGRQVLLLQEVGDADFELRAIGVDSPLNLTVVSTVSTNGARSSPGRGDVSWQPIFP
jgi:hypothetical protein